MEEPELSYTADENEGTVTLENSFIIKHTPTLWSSHSTPRYLFKRNGNTCSHKAQCKNSHNSHISQTGNNLKIQQVKGALKKWSLYNGILLSYGAEQTADTENMDPSQYCSVESKNPDTKQYILYNSIYIKS